MFRGGKSNRVLSVGALLAAFGVASAMPAHAGNVAVTDQKALQPCERLAVRARQLPDGVWMHGSKALGPMLKIGRPQGKKLPSAYEDSLSKLPMVKGALGDEDGNWSIFVDHLTGIDLYSASSIQGTLHCQNTIFLKRQARRSIRLIDGPPLFIGLFCWDISGDFGRAFGVPVFVANEMLFQSKGENIQIAPWSGVGWRPACRLELRFRTDYKITGRFCGDQTACDAVGKIARDVMAAYNQSIEKGDDGEVFKYGSPPTTELQIAFDAALDARKSSGAFLNFSTFGAASDLDVSYSGLAVFPLTLAGRTYAAAVGHEGVGWRVGEDTLLSIYDIKGDALIPLATFVIAPTITGLATAVAKPAIAVGGP